jgi:uncharacterized membrane protein YukC
MNPELIQQKINMSYRFKYIAIGLITYVVAIYAWSFYQKKD